MVKRLGLERIVCGSGLALQVGVVSFFTIEFRAAPPTQRKTHPAKTLFLKLHFRPSITISTVFLSVRAWPKTCVFCWLHVLQSRGVSDAPAK